MIVKFKATVAGELIEIRIESTNAGLATQIKNTVSEVLFAQGPTLTSLDVTVT